MEPSSVQLSNVALPFEVHLLKTHKTRNQKEWQYFRRMIDHSFGKEGFFLFLVVKKKFGKKNTKTQLLQNLGEAVKPLLPKGVDVCLLVK